MTPYTRKRRLDGSHLACRSEAMPLSRVFVLDRPGKHRSAQPLAMPRLRGADGLIAILQCTFQLDIEDAARGAARIRPAEPSGQRRSRRIG